MQVAVDLLSIFVPGPADCSPYPPFPATDSLSPSTHYWRHGPSKRLPFVNRRGKKKKEKKEEEISQYWMLDQIGEEEEVCFSLYTCERGRQISHHWQDSKRWSSFPPLRYVGMGVLLGLVGLDPRWQGGRMWREQFCLLRPDMSCGRGGASGISGFGGNVGGRRRRKNQHRCGWGN